jgi:hypothetical protein
MRLEHRLLARELVQLLRRNAPTPKRAELYSTFGYFQHFSASIEGNCGLANYN